MRFDDSLKTVLSADMDSGFGAQSAWRQLVDLMGRGRIAADEPGLARLRMLEEVHARHPGLRVLMLSMYDNPEYVQRALQAGARGYVLKDAPAADIVSAIQTVAEGGTYLSPAVAGRLFRGQAPRPVLTPREAEILSALGRGHSSKQIARDLDLSVRTVETHRQSIKRKLGIEGQAELIKYAVEHTRDDGTSG